MKILNILLLLLFFAACTPSNEHKFTIVNRSPYVLDSAKITTLEVKIVFPSIAIGESLSMKYLEPNDYNSEGDFSGTFYFRDTTIRLVSFGYYSNTHDIQKHLKVEIDPLLVVRERAK